MRKTVLVALCLLPGLALAQGYDHGPISGQASHTPGSTPGSTIAPRLPDPAGGDGGSPEQYLHEADRALVMHKTGLAQQALEMAETRLLDRSTLASQASTPDDDPEVQALRRARRALGQRDVHAAQAAIREALNDAPGAAGTPTSDVMPPTYPAPPGGLGAPPPSPPGFPPPNASR